MAKYDKWIKESGLTLIKGWAKDGLVASDIAHNMGISRATLFAWSNKFKEIEDALDEGKEVADRRVENSLYMKATGITKTLKKPMKIKKTEYDAKTGKKISEREEIELVDEEVYIPPDVTAQKFWLINRKPDTWKDKRIEENIIDAEEEAVVMIEQVEDMNEYDIVETPEKTINISEKT